MNNRIDLKTRTLEKLKTDEKYNKVLSNVDEETQKKIDDIVRNFIGNLSEQLSKLDDPEIKKKITELLNDKRNR